MAKKQDNWCVIVTDHNADTSVIGPFLTNDAAHEFVISLLNNEWSDTEFEEHGGFWEGMDGEQIEIQMMEKPHRGP